MYSTAFHGVSEHSWHFVTSTMAEKKELDCSIYVFGSISSHSIKAYLSTALAM